jgi:hypothetical protein
MADALMFRFAIKEAQIRTSQPADERIKPVKISVEIGKWNSDMLGWIGSVCEDVANHCRCKVRLWSGHNDENVWVAKVYGFESDVRYFEILYTTLRHHFLGILMPRMDPQLSLQENAYRLHEAGYNWLDMAGMDGWKKYPGQPKSTPGHLVEYYNQDLNPPFGGRTTAGKIGGMYKRAYQAACRERGEAPRVISAGGTRGYRSSAAMGYESRLNQRLAAAREAREGQPGEGIVLRSAFEDVEAMYREDNPELFKKIEPREEDKGTKQRVRKVRYSYPKFNEGAYAAGVKYANTADLGTGVGGAPRRELG